MLRSWLHPLATSSISEARPLPLLLKKRVDGRQPRPGARYVNRGCAVRQDWTWKYELALNNVGAGG
jgi:hypothetical protein